MGKKTPYWWWWWCSVSQRQSGCQPFVHPGLMAKALLYLARIKNQIKSRQHSVGGGRQTDLWTLTPPPDPPSSAQHRWSVDTCLPPYTACKGGCCSEPASYVANEMHHSRQVDGGQMEEREEERWNWRLEMSGVE